MNPDRRTPREWLLDRHASRQSDLDRIRQAAVASETTDTGADTVAALIRALVKPNAFAWGMLAAIWAALLAFHVAKPTRPISSQGTRVGPAAVAAFLQQLKNNDRLAQIDSGS